MNHEISNLDEAKKVLEEISSKDLYIVGAGEFGQYVGEYLNKNNYSWNGYIDLKRRGTLDGKNIHSYDHCSENRDANYFIASPQLNNAMKKKLLEKGICEDNIYYFRSCRVLYELYGEVNLLMQKLLDGAYRECSFGEKNPDRTYMILERSMIYEGVLSNVRRFLMGLDYADRKGFIPVIDQLYFPAFLCQNNDTIGIENPWEYFFEQPGGVGLKEVLDGCKNVRYYNMDDTINVNYLSEPLIVTENLIERLDYWHKIAQKYLKLTPEMEKLVEEAYNKMFPKGAKVLGTKIREGMMITIEKKKNRGSLPVQPDLKKVIDDVKKYAKEWGNEYIYLMCETEDVKNMFYDQFGEKLICMDLYRPKYSEFMDAAEIQNEILHNNEIDKVQNAKDYLVETWLLSKCDSIISGDNGATEMACVIKGGYDNMILYHKGYTPNFTI